MLGQAGLGIAFNAKPKVQEIAQVRINQPSLVNVLYLLGLNQDEIDKLSN
jgi:phosphoserine phosphatase